MTATPTADASTDTRSGASAGTAPPALDLRRVGVNLGGRPVLRAVTVTVQPGEFVGLIGPNGAGKTTLLRAVLALIPVANGSISVDGRTPRRGRSGIGYVPQRHEFAWDFPIDVESVVLTGREPRIGWLRRPRVADYRAANEALERVGMTNLARRPVGELSGGQRQRVLVARALALRPGLLLLDEPFTGLDMPTVELLLDLFAELAGEGTAVVMTTHDLLGALDRCHRLILLNRTVTADAPPDRLTDPQVWMRTFDVGPASPLLRLTRMV